jgi:hypothetical protein
MFKIKIYCNDGDIQYWEDGVGTYETYDKALVACYGNALEEAKSLMMNADRNKWFEVEEKFEVTETYTNNNLELGTLFETTTVCYDHAPQDRENDCGIQIMTGYKIVDCIIDTTLIAFYDSMQQITMSCKLNTNTKEIFDIKIPKIVENFNSFQGFYLNIEGVLHPVILKHKVKNDEYWYKEDKLYENETHC